ncbi:hypothetical protein ACCS96_21100, partial [Rhizobium ruizarguesonis]
MAISGGKRAASSAGRNCMTGAFMQALHGKSPQFPASSLSLSGILPDRVDHLCACILCAEWPLRI